MPYSLKPRTISSTRPCGLSRSHRIRLSGLDLIPDLSGAIYVPDFQALLIADMHLERLRGAGGDLVRELDARLGAGVEDRDAALGAG